VSGGVLLVGAGAVGPLGLDRRAIEAASRDRASAGDAAPKTRVEGFDASSLPNAKSLRRATAHVLFGVAAAAEAARESGGAALPEESGLVFASALGSANFSYRLWHELLKSGPLGASPVLFSEGVPNALAGHVALSLRLLGPGHMLGGGSDAGLRAVSIGRDLLESRRLSRVVVGAAEEHSELAVRAYRRLGLAARGAGDGERPGIRRGVTRGRALVPSEGAAAFVLERDDPPPKRPALARLLAVESAQLSRRDRESDARELAELLRRAADAAGGSLRDLSWLGSAANGTHVDAIEARALALLAADGFEPVVSRRMRAWCGEAWTVTPLWQALEALPIVAAGGRAAVLSVSPFCGASVLVLAAAGSAQTRRP